ncbi:MAG TPA: ATP-binding cassette domain-containing protein, partial [Rhabdochlamydiaceae bacterium]|nr:ATP-binding cassette domain-containing protein [Rhabdochlamydiaceae bacterium]
MALIEIKNLSQSFVHAGKAVTALQDVTCSIEKGDVFGIIGQSGAGKSTLIRSLAGLVRPSSGAIQFQGNDIAGLQGEALRGFRRNIGMIFQHFNLLSSRTVAGNIGYALEIAKGPKESQKERIDLLLGMVGLKDKKSAYPSQLSGGEKQ